MTGTAGMANGHGPMTELSGVYYAACNALFRSCTTQEELMLRETLAFWRSMKPESILSVGSGAGLFELPLLHALRADDLGPARFVGVDVSPEACEILTRRLRSEFPAEGGFEVVCQSFQDFETPESFDVVLFNHTFEYLRGTALKWLAMSRILLSGVGKILIFSPDPGGINRIYAEEMQNRNGWKPHFSDDIEAALRSSGIPFSDKRLTGRCEVSLLEQPLSDEKTIMLLSFLTQTDCRDVPDSTKRGYVEYYLSLRDKEGNSIPHPTTMFVV